MRRTLSIIPASFCAFFLSCCDCGPLCTTVTYEVEGWASHVSVEYNDDYGDRVYHSKVALPWIDKFSIKNRSNEYHGGANYSGIYTAYIKAIVVSGEYITVTVYVNGKAVKTKTTTPTEKTAEIYYAVHH